MILFLLLTIFSQAKILSKVLSTWLIIFTIVVIDIYFEFSTVKFLGFNDGTYGNRIVSFFKDEPIVGGYIHGFCLIILGFLLTQFQKLNKDLIILFSLMIFISVILTGERANSIKLFLSLFLFITFVSSIDLKKKIIYFFIGLILTSIMIVKTDYLKLRFVKQIINVPVNESLYVRIYKSGYEVFKHIHILELEIKIIVK